MELTLSGILTDLITQHLPISKLGVIVRGMRAIDPVTIAETVANRLSRPLAVAIVGYPVRATTADLELATDIESAVNWRNQGDTYLQRMLVFVPADVEKLGSLEMLDVLTTREVAKHLTTWAAEHLASNPPQAHFWTALGDSVEALPFNMLLNFAVGVEQQTRHINAIPLQLWQLGLLEDETLLNANIDVGKQLQRNRDLVLAMSQLSDRSRRTMTQSLRSATGDEAVHLRNAARQLRRFFERGELSALKGLRLADVDLLLEIGKRELLISPPSPPSSSTSDYEEGTTAGLYDSPRREQSLRGTELAETIASYVVTGADKEAVGAYVDLLRDRLQDDQSDQDEPSNLEALQRLSAGRPILPNVNKQTRSHFSFVSMLCSDYCWGGVVQAEQHTLHDVIQRFTVATPITPFNPSTSPNRGKSLVDLLASFDTWLSLNPSFATLWQQMAMARSVLVSHIDVLILDPVALLYSNDEARQAVIRYLDAYSQLLSILHHSAPVLRDDKSPTAYYAVLQGLLRLDVIFVATPGDDVGDVHRRWKALLTPLHPLHLWRYRTVLERTGPNLSLEEQVQLTKALPKLPHLLHFVATNDAQLGKVTLPQAGSIETLPIYENRTNRYLGTDGTEFLGHLLKRWLEFAPYSQAQIRLALIDAPHLPAALSEIETLLRERPKVRIVVDVYCTRRQNIREHLAEMDYEGQDSVVADLLLGGRLSLNLYEDCTSLSVVTERLKIRPVHIVFSFDQSSYDLSKSARHRHTVVSPLVITYKYTFDQSYNKGSIEPSSDADSGVFADYHFVVNQAIELEEDESFHVQIGSGNDVDALNQILVNEGARWLVVADRTMLGYAPVQAVPLVEQLQGRREVAVWAHTSSRSVRQFVDLLRKYNLTPEENHVAELMRQYGHIAAGGLFSAARANNLNMKQRESQHKGLIGIVIATHWYKTQYPGALVASLDSGLARQWLWLQDSSNERADLIGFRTGEANNLIIDIIEVKAVERSQREVQVTPDPTSGKYSLSGPAIEQLRSTLEKIQPIFAQEDNKQDLFTHARSEALKYQLYREGFRETHPGTDRHRWTELLNAAFREKPDLGSVVVRCYGTVIHVFFEENGETEFLSDKSNEISLVRLRTLAIQRLVTSSSSIPIASQVPAQTPPSTQQETIPSAALTIDSLPLEQASSPTIEQKVIIAPVAPLPTPSSAPSIEELVGLAKRVDRALATHNVRANSIDPVQTQVGPSIIRFLVRLRGDEKLRKVQSVAVELQRELQLMTVPFVDNVPGTTYIGIDIPRPSPETVPLLPLLETQTLMQIGVLPVILGKTPDGQLLTGDLVEFPHLLVAGATRSGKSVFLRSLLLSLLQTRTASELELLIIDAKRTDFAFFNGIPHLRGGAVVNEAVQAIDLLLNLVRTEMRQRQTILAEHSVLQLSDFNRRFPEKALPYVVAIIDEYAQLITTMNKRDRETFESELMNLAGVGRSTGIHLVLATQRPSADIVSSKILANLDCRAVFRVANQRNSQVILDQGGAENLLGRGDMLFRDASGLIQRLQAPYMDDIELRAWVQMYITASKETKC